MQHLSRTMASARSTPLSSLDPNRSAPSSGNKTLRRRKATEDLTASITSILQSGGSDENAPPSAGGEQRRKGNLGRAEKRALGERSVNFAEADSALSGKEKDNSLIIEGLPTPPASQEPELRPMNSSDRSTNEAQRPPSAPTSNSTSRKRVRTTSLKTSPNPRARKSAKSQVINVLKRASRSPQPSPAKPTKAKKPRSSLPTATTSSHYLITVAGPITPIKAVYMKPRALTTGRHRSAIPLHLHRTPPKIDLTPSDAPPSPGDDPLLLTGTEVVKHWRKSRSKREPRTITLVEDTEEIPAADTTIAWENGAAPVSPVQDSGWGDPVADGFNDDDDDGQWQDYDVPLVSPGPQDVSMRIATPARVSAKSQTSIEYTVPVVNSPANTSMRLSTPSRPPSKSPSVIAISSMKKGHRRNYSITSEGSLPSPKSSLSPEEAQAILPVEDAASAPESSLLIPPSVDKRKTRALTPVSPPRAESSVFSSVLPERSLSPPSESSSDNQLGLTFAASYVTGMSPAAFRRILHSPGGLQPATKSRELRTEKKTRNVMFSDATSIPDDPEWLDEDSELDDGLSILKTRLSLYRAARDIPSPVSTSAVKADKQIDQPATTQLPEVHVDAVDAAGVEDPNTLDVDDVDAADEDQGDQGDDEDGYVYDDADFMGMGDMSDGGSEPEDAVVETVDREDNERQQDEEEDAVNQSLMLAEPVLSDGQEDEELEPEDHLLADLAEQEFEDLVDEDEVIRDTTPEEEEDNEVEDILPESTAEERAEEEEIFRETTLEKETQPVNECEHQEDEEPEYEERFVPLRSPSPSPSPPRAASPKHEVVIEGTDPLKCAKIAMILKRHGLDVEEVIEPVDGFVDSPRSLRKRRESGRFNEKLKNSPLTQPRGKERRPSFVTADGDVSVPNDYLLDHVEASLAEGSMDASLLSALAHDTTLMAGTPLRQAVLTRRAGHAAGEWTKSDWKRLHKLFFKFRHTLAVAKGVGDLEMDLDLTQAHALVMEFCAIEGVVPGLTGHWSRQKMLSRVEALGRLERRKTMSPPRIKLDPEETSVPLLLEERRSTTESSSSTTPPSPPLPPPVPSMLPVRRAQSHIPRPIQTGSASNSLDYAGLLHQAHSATSGRTEQRQPPTRSTPRTAQRGVVGQLQAAMNSRATASPSMAGRLSVFLSGMMTNKKAVPAATSIPGPASQARGPASVPRPPPLQEMTEVLRPRPVTPLITAAADASSDSLLSQIRPLRHVEPTPRGPTEDLRISRRRSSGSVKDLLVQYEGIQRKEEKEKERVDTLRKQASMRRLSDEAAAAGP
ncbi:hypothetical protein CALVIDRAFT_553832 [Calocera viscosa TUFC12733]|uniref:Uncharacterized protein n=1 Tax=Calocera viscosa (strain TUFC12733) TaxID=1330018 RepID=A0A167P9Z8_CALVF|nr:hypothetical protein CALVIDRAFT_553832 [Calocera viscosa TUFC12733]